MGGCFAKRVVFFWKQPRKKGMRSFARVDTKVHVMLEKGINVAEQTVNDAVWHGHTLPLFAGHRFS